MFKLSINTSPKEPDTRLTKANIDRLQSELEDAKTKEEVFPIIDQILEAQINEYQTVELNRLRAFLNNTNYKFEEITSTLKGLLLRLQPSANRAGGRRHGSRKAKTRRLSRKRRNGKNK